MSKWLPSIIAAVAAAGSIFVPVIQGYEALHPTFTAILAGLGVVIAHILPSPTAGK